MNNNNNNNKRPLDVVPPSPPPPPNCMPRRCCRHVELTMGPVCDLGCTDHKTEHCSRQPFMRAFLDGDVSRMRRCTVLLREFKRRKGALVDEWRTQALYPDKEVAIKNSGVSETVTLFKLAIRKGLARVVEFWVEASVKSIDWKHAMERAIHLYEEEFRTPISDLLFETALRTLEDEVREADGTADSKEPTSESFRAHVRMFNSLYLGHFLDDALTRTPKYSIRAISDIYQSSLWGELLDDAYLSVKNLVCALVRFYRSCVPNTNDIMTWFTKSAALARHGYGYGGQNLAEVTSLGDGNELFEMLPPDCMWIMCPSWFVHTGHLSLRTSCYGPIATTRHLLYGRTTSKPNDYFCLESIDGIRLDDDEADAEGQVQDIDNDNDTVAEVPVCMWSS